MARRNRPSLTLTVLGLEPGSAGSGSGRPAWSWPPGLASEQALPGLLAGRFEPGPTPSQEIDDCHRDDPDRRALAAAGLDEQTDALERALGDWLLTGGDREGFERQLAEWRRQGYARLLAFDPVHLKAETDHAITFGPRFLALDPADLDDLLTALNEWLSGDGMRAERIGGQVYLLAACREDGVGPAAAHLSRAGAPLACLLNRNAGVFIDEQRSEPVLRQWLTELQMWLYPQPLNDKRAARGQPILSSFWPHGIRTIPERLPAPREPEAMLITDSPALLARVDRAVAWPVDEEAIAEAVHAGRRLHVVVTETGWCRLEGDLGGFQQELQRIDAWLAGIRSSLPRMPIELDDGQGGRWRPRPLWQRLLARLSGGRRA